MPNFRETRASLYGGAALVAVFAAGAMTSLPSPVLADAVKIEAPQAVPNFADVVEAVSPAVVSVRVRSAVRPAAFDGANGENPFRRFFEGNPFGQFERDRSRGP
ncbi:MAG: serine protease, partial [Pseudomonadota bacterium]